MEGDALLLTTSGQTAIITLNRPEKLNALNYRLWEALDRELRAVCNSKEVNGIVITGRGRAFSSGDDILDMLNLNSLEASEKFFKKVVDTLETMIYCRKPLVAAVNGIAAGGGAEMLLLADYVVAVDNAMILYPEAKLKLHPPILLTVGLARIGVKAYRLALTGDRIDAESAKSLGIIDELVSTPELAVQRAIARAKSIYATSGHLLPWSRISSLGGPETIESMERLVMQLSRDVLKPEAKDAMKSFLQKRKHS